MKVLGKMIYNMAMAKKLGWMDQSIRETTSKERNMVTVSILGMMAQDMKESGKKIK